MPEGLHRQLHFMPYCYIEKGIELVFGKACLAHHEDLAGSIPDRALADYVGRILAMYCDAGPDGGPGPRLSGIGVFRSPGMEFFPISERDNRDLHGLQVALFLAMLARNVRLGSINAGFMMWTAENVGIVRQNFEVGSGRTAESSGVIVERTIGGYHVDTMRYLTPSHIPSPIRFHVDRKLLDGLDKLRRVNGALLRRILDAGDMVRASYFNTHSVDQKARVLLMCAAFERLLDLPEHGQRKAFKEALESALSTERDRRFRYLSARGGGRREAEKGTIFKYWGDRFYLLRNQIIHGDRVPDSQMLFRGAQWHHHAAATIFIGLVVDLIARAFLRRSRLSPVAAKVRWVKPDRTEDPESRPRFKLVDDYGMLLANHKLRGRRIRARRSVGAL